MGGLEEWRSGAILASGEPGLPMDSALFAQRIEPLGNVGDDSHASVWDLKRR